MMGTAVDMSQKLGQMHDTAAKKEFTEVAEGLISYSLFKELGILSRLCERYEKLSRENLGLRTTRDNLQYQLKSYKTAVLGKER